MRVAVRNTSASRQYITTPFADKFTHVALVYITSGFKESKKRGVIKPLRRFFSPLAYNNWN